MAATTNRIGDRRLHGNGDAPSARPPRGSSSSGERGNIADFVIDNVAACAAAAAILSRGLRFMNQAWLRACSMSADDGLRIVKAMCMARSGREWIGLERHLYMRASSWTISRATMLAVMAVQLGEDAVVPLTRRLDAALDLMA